ncbi:unnamed protein product [Urochloa humidicola]
MDAMDEFQEADILWPETEDELVAAPFATTDDMVMEEAYGVAASPVSTVAPVLRCRRFEGIFLPGAAGTSPQGDDDDEEEEWQEADVLWPDTASIVSRGGGGGGLLWPFAGGSGRAGQRANHPAAAARRDRWRPAASSPIDIPCSAAARRRYKFGTAMSRRP